MKNERKIRWKSLVVGLVLLAAALVGVRQIPALRDSMYSGALMVLALLCVGLWGALWVLFVSGARWRTRGLWLLIGALGAAALIALVRVEGYHGDIVPQLRWAWEPPLGAVYDDLDVTAPTWRRDPPGAVDSPQFLGPGGTNQVGAQTLPADWATAQPTELWRRKVGLGWSSFAVARGLAITQEQRDDREHVVAYALEDGTPIWTHHNQARFSEQLGGDGPRATPAVAGERVLALGGTGILDCLDLETGELHWSRQVLTENRHLNLEWGKSSSPLVVGELVIVALGEGEGGSLAAYELTSGEPRWRAGAFEASYATPVLRTLDGEEQLLVVYADHLAGHRVASGELLWSTPIPRAAANVANPVLIPPDRVLVTIGYGKGALLFRVARSAEGAWEVEPLWKSMALKTKFTNVVVRDGHAYGLDEGRMACVELAGGDRVWKGGRYGHGQVLGVGEHLLVQAENGRVVVVEANPAGSRKLTSFVALDSKTWNQPVLAGRYLLVRNDREAVCYRYSGER